KVVGFLNVIEARSRKNVHVGHFAFSKSRKMVGYDVGVGFDVVLERVELQSAPMVQVVEYSGYNLTRLVRPPNLLDETVTERLARCLLWATSRHPQPPRHVSRLGL